MKEYHAPFKPNCFYHIYNRGNNKEKLFLNDDNYAFFLHKWEYYLSEYLDVWAYCLMPNHFHFLTEVNDQNSFPEKTFVNEFLEKRFKRLFSSYTLSFNKVYDRSGSLFQKRFKRLKISSNSYLLALIHYIHHNPIHHNFTENYDGIYSSYPAILSKSPTKINRDEVLNVFGGRSDFIKIHAKEKNYKKIKHLIVE
ncbi:MAG TPA: transposase [Balneolaceae bacterium]